MHFCVTGRSRTGHLTSTRPDPTSRPNPTRPATGAGRPDRFHLWTPTGGVLNITAAVWTSGFHWWRSGNKKRTQNVSEYMLVLALSMPGLLVKLIKLFMFILSVWEIITKTVISVTLALQVFRPTLPFA